MSRFRTAAHRLYRRGHDLGPARSVPRPARAGDPRRGRPVELARTATVDSTNADLHALQEGDDAALSRLIARWKKPLFLFAWTYLRNTTDANELVAEVFVRLYQQRMRLSPDSNLKAWLYTILTNLCHNHYRWRRRHTGASLDAACTAGRDGTEITLADVLSSDGPDPAHLMEKGETLA